MGLLRIFWAGLLLFSQVAAGQSFAYRAGLGSVPADGFYRVLLPPAVRALLQPDLADLRLVDRQNQEVPYLLVRQETAPTGSRPRYLPVAGLRWRQHGNLQHKKTILRFSAPAPVPIDRLVFTIAAPALYHRQATLYRRQEHRGRRERRGRRPRDYQPVSQFVLAANQDNVLLLSGFRSADFYVEIQNGDNPPLVIEKVGAYQLPTYLVASLSAGQTYHLAFGSQERMYPPAYDLAYFRNQIPRQLPTLEPGQISRAAEGRQPAGHPANAFFTNRYLIWAALLAVIALLGYMSYKILKETGKKI
jgi:Protein of unknown function (DUF3999)